MDKEKDDFLRTEYEFLNKAYEIQFTHFMGVFYFWIAVIGIPTTAGIITNHSDILCIGAGLMGVFLSAKMFDHRHSQYWYIAKMNELRNHFWLKFDIEKVDKIEMAGKNADLKKAARKDFGVKMAWIMSIFNSALIAVGIYLLPIFKLGWGNIVLAVAIFILVISLNVYFYYRIVVWRIK